MVPSVDSTSSEPALRRLGHVLQSLGHAARAHALRHLGADVDDPGHRAIRFTQRVVDEVEEVFLRHAVVIAVEGDEKVLRLEGCPRVEHLLQRREQRVARLGDDVAESLPDR